ncbi:muscle-specific protein 20-like isoform X2 [Watersipora subatra]|uniref:muscle-specific protein 20-like isoform X2 n=1 Tax=Watersipora subatra TaxID=2589382 RepID=UPI00355AF98A
MSEPSNRAALSGIAHDIAKKVAKNRDPEAEAKAVAWMKEVLKKDPPPGTYEESLRNGVYLCELINAIAPNSVKKIHQKGQAFTVMQNIEAFQKALVAYGVPAEDLFQTVDLWEKRNIPAVTKTIYALSRTAGFKGWQGPTIPYENPAAKMDI